VVSSDHVNDERTGSDMPPVVDHRIRGSSAQIRQRVESMYVGLGLVVDFRVRQVNCGVNVWNLLRTPGFEPVSSFLLLTPPDHSMWPALYKKEEQRGAP